jgi:hypothetical protein
MAEGVLAFTAEDARLAFGLFDKDGDGNISAAELDHVVTSLGDQLSPAELQSMLDEAAHTQKADGVSFDAFEALVCSLEASSASGWKNALQAKLKSLLEHDSHDDKSWGKFYEESPDIKQYDGTRWRL